MSHIPPPVSLDRHPHRGRRPRTGRARTGRGRNVELGDDTTSESTHIQVAQGRSPRRTGRARQTSVADRGSPPPRNEDPCATGGGWPPEANRGHARYGSRNRRATAEPPTDAGGNTTLRFHLDQHRPRGHAREAPPHSVQHPRGRNPTRTGKRSTWGTHETRRRTGTGHDRTPRAPPASKWWVRAGSRPGRNPVTVPVVEDGYTGTSTQASAGTGTSRTRKPSRPGFRPTRKMRCGPRRGAKRPRRGGKYRGRGKNPRETPLRAISGHLRGRGAPHTSPQHHRRAGQPHRAPGAPTPAAPP